MITYLKDGWYKHGAERQLRTEVVDGAIDAASMLFQASVPPHVLSGVAFKLRTLVSIVDPMMTGTATLGSKQRERLWQKIEPLVLGYPVLDAFVRDCLEHVRTPSDLRAFYLHLIHVTQMVQLLSAAIGPMGIHLGSMLASTPPPAKKAAKAAPKPSRARKPSGKKSATVAKTTKKAAATPAGTQKKKTGKKAAAKATKKAARKPVAKAVKKTSRATRKKSAKASALRRGRSTR